MVEQSTESSCEPSTHPNLAKSEASALRDITQLYQVPSRSPFDQLGGFLKGTRGPQINGGVIILP